MPTHDGIEEGERLPVLHRGVAAADDAEHIETVLAGDGVLVGHRQAQEAVVAIAGVQGQLLDLPVQPGGLDGFLCGGGFVEGGAKAVPGHAADVHHAGFSVLDHELWLILLSASFLVLLVSAGG